MGNYIPYGRQVISEDDIAAVVDTLRSDYLTQGPVVASFESAIARRVGANYAVAVNSATSALHVACMALGVSAGDYLWTSPVTFVASANCGRYCGAEVDFVDIDPKTGLMSMLELERKLQKARKCGKLPKVVIPVHFAGSSCDMKTIGRLAAEYNFAVIEDASHAIGGTYMGGPVGSCQYSSITVFSFHPVKIITTGEGGIATTNDEQIAEIMIGLRSHGITKDFTRFKGKQHEPWRYEQQALGFNYRMSDIHAALGLSQLKNLADIIKYRNEIRDIYTECLSELPTSFLGIPDGCISAVHLVVLILDWNISERRDSLFDFMRSKSIGVQLHYYPVHLQPYYRNLGFKEGDYPNAESYAKGAISLPVYKGLARADQDRVISVIKEFFD